MALPVNMLQESQKYQNLQDFMRARDSKEILALYMLDEGQQSSFFSNFPELMYQQFDMSAMIGDVIKLRFTNLTVGNGTVGPSKISRQLAGNEAMSRAAYRQISMSIGQRSYAVAIENLIDRKTLPQVQINAILTSSAQWYAKADDRDSFLALFRDYSWESAETDGLTAAEITDRVYTLFGRGFNDTLGKPQVKFSGNGTKTDIEPGAAVTGYLSVAAGDRVGLADTDTLTATFINSLSQFISNQMRMPCIELDSNMGKPFYGMIIEAQDMIYLYDNSASTLVSQLQAISGYHNVGPEIVKQHPIFTKHLDALYNINFFRYDTIDKNSNKDMANPKQIPAFKNSIHEDLEGKSIKPEAKVLAAATTGDVVSGLQLLTNGYLVPGLTRGVSTVAATYQLFVSHGAELFPYYDGTAIGADSVNHIDIGLWGGGAVTGTYYGRMQIGQGNTATTKWKIVYKGPVYSGAIQVGINNDLNTYVEDAYKLEIKSLHRWNPATASFDAANTLVADWATFKAFLGINAVTNVIDPTLRTLAIQYNRRCHMFDVVRTIVFGKSLLYKVNGGTTYATEVRDYEAFTGTGMRVLYGKKLVESGHGLINNYMVLCFKRPPVLL